MFDRVLTMISDHFSRENLLTLMLLWGTVACAAAITFVRSGKSWRQHLLPTIIFTHPSARADFWFWIARRLTKLVYLLPASATVTVLTGTIIHNAFATILPPHAATPAGPGMVVVFTITMLLAYDLSYYIYHYLQHKVPVLWDLHKVHHSAEVMVGITEGRVHPLDDLMTHIWDGIIPGVAYGIWLFFLFDPVEVTIFGINVYVMRNILMMDFVRHTHFKLSFGKWINAVILCPHWHQLHHSADPRHWDKNFGLMLSIWDRMFGTLVEPQPDEEFKFGLAHDEHLDYRSVGRLYLVPLNKICNILLPVSRPKHPE